MKYDPSREKCPLPFSPFKSCTVPRPIGWLSSVSPDGIDNLAPYSQWQNLTFDPPMVMFAANQYPDGRRKDTVLNAEQTGWFVWNMATYSLREAVNLSAMAVPSHQSEFDLAGVTRRRADLCNVQMVAESPVHFECRYLSTHRFAGNSKVGTIDVVFAQVERIHIDENFLTPEEARRPQGASAGQAWLLRLHQRYGHLRDAHPERECRRGRRFGGDAGLNWERQPMAGCRQPRHAEPSHHQSRDMP